MLSPVTSHWCSSCFQNLKVYPRSSLRESRVSALSPSLLCGDSPKLEQIYDTHSVSRLADTSYDSQPQPVFDPEHSGDVTAILGKTAILNCRVSGVANRTVSWIRHKDTHLLTAGRYTYTSDMRFRAIHKVMSEDFLLQILPVKVV